MPKRTVLMTGATGYIAAQLLPVFREQYELTLVDVKDTDPQGNTLPLSDNFYSWAKATYEYLGFVFACGHFGRQ